MGKKPRWDVTEAQVGQVETLTGYGLKLEEIAAYLGVSKVTFERACKKNNSLREALLKGRVKADAKVSESLFRQATSGKCPAATIFWMKVRRCWKEPPAEVQFPDKDGNPQAVSGPQIVLTMPDNGRSVK